MAYVFRIHDIKGNNPQATAPIAAANVKDWAATDYIQGNLIDNIEISNSPRKMGTSIPSFFSRIFLFQGAFSTLGNNVSTHLLINPNTKLVSECFDMLEFLFQNGQSEKLVVRHWNATNQIQALVADGTDKHRRLAAILQDEMVAYPELNDIYLFYWCSVSSATQAPVEHLIGGTSPYTLVFTSPNWKKHMQASGWTFNRLNGTPMFDDNNYQALSQRADEFKNMVYGLYNAFALAMSTKAEDFKKYCNLAWNSEIVRDPAVLAMANNPVAFNAVYKTISAVDSTEVMCFNIPIVYKEIVATTSDYTILCTSNRYKQYNYNNTNIVLAQDPLVLNEAGISNANYVGTTKWNNATCKINVASVKGVPMHLRTLPGGMGIQAPFLIASDFLEDSIVKLPYTIDNSHFVTAFDGNSQYLLPLRPYFFEYFNVEDLEKVVDTQGHKMLTIQAKKIGSEDAIEAVLRIPVVHKLPNAQYNSVIVLSNTYKGTSILKSEKAQLNIGIFPFYRVTDIPSETDAEKHNKYTVALVGRDNVSLEFKNIKIQEKLQSNGILRSPSGSIVLGSTYYDVNGAFDLVLVNVDGTKALLIPRFKAISQSNIKVPMSIAIDFGTSNTYVATKKQNGNPVPLVIDGTNSQVVFIKDAKANCNDQTVILSQEILNREFIPVTLGQTDSTCSFPMRTATCELRNFQALQPKLFANVSVGFNFQNEKVIGNFGNFNYITDLKWALEKDPAATAYQNRVRNYFKGLLWIIKNQCLLEDCGLPDKIYVTYPQAMVVPTRNALKACWETAFKELNLDFNNLYVQDNESVAPYHAMAKSVMGASHMNIDIGGGTSDILYVVKQNGQIQNAYFCSTKFAADDLWGDGISIVQDGNMSPKDNGFKKYLDEQITSIKDTLDSEIYLKYTAICDFAHNSSDIMGFLFKNDNVLQTSLKIQGQQNLYSLIFVHFAATLYNVARILRNKGLEIPEVLTFTGLGSKYTNMISSEDTDIAQLAKILLEQFTDKKAPRNFSVIREPNSKEVTANGALIGPILTPTYKVNGNLLEQIQDYGFDTSDNIKYEDVANEDIKQSVVAEYCKFIDILKTNEVIKTHLYTKFNHTIKSSLLQDLEDKATTSYQNVSGSMIQYGDINVNETLFFWPLKHAIYEVSKNYNQYK